MYRVFSAKRSGMAIKLTRAGFWHFWCSADYPTPFFLYLFPPPIYVCTIQMDTLSCLVLFFAMFQDYYGFAIKNKECTLQPWIGRGTKVWKSWNWAMDEHSLNVFLYTTECFKKRRRKPHGNCSIKTKFIPNILNADVCCGWVLS